MTAVPEVEAVARAVEAARRAGADEADAWLRTDRALTATVRDGAVEELIDAGERTLALRVFVGGRTALAYGSDPTPDALARMAEQAVALAKLVDDDPCAGLPDGPFADGAASPDLHDPAVATADPTHLIALARRAESAALGHDPRVTISGGTTVFRRSGTTALANSRGFAGRYAETACSLTVTAIADDAEGKKRDGWWWTSDRRLAGLDEAEEVGREAARRAVQQLGARKVPTQEAPVVWSPEMARALVEIVAQAASGEARYRGRSFLVGQEGQAVASPLVTIGDDGTLPGGLGSRPFDGEGLASRRTPLVEAGRFVGFLHDTYTARKAGTASTANAGRAVVFQTGATLAVAPSNLSLAAGETPPEAIIAGVDRGLYLTALLGFGENLTTGDFSRGAAGVWIEGGELAYPVAEINIAGRLQDILTDIDAVGTDALTLDAVSAPTVRVARMTISGS